jgi:hypothetical protein
VGFVEYPVLVAGHRWQQQQGIPRAGNTKTSSGPFLREGFGFEYIFEDAARAQRGPYNGSNVQAQLTKTYLKHVSIVPLLLAVVAGHEEEQ